MPLTCVSENPNINKPSNWTDSPTTKQSKPVFVLNGAPISNKPQSLQNLGERVLKENSVKKPLASRAATDYWFANLASENIIGSDTKTSLRYENQTYTQKFIAIHTGIWGDTGLFVSLFLMADNNDMFHIYIPVALTTTAQDENIFLKSWLNTSNRDPLPSGFTINELLTFRGIPSNMVDFAIVNDCLSYFSNNNKVVSHYTLCKFKTRLNLNNGPNQNLIGAWITPARMSVAENPVETTPSTPYRRKTFNQIFNFMLNGIIVNRLDTNMVDNTSKYLNESSTPTSASVPVFYSVNFVDMRMTGKIEDFSVRGTGIKGLKNVKCYPIDLVQQVDDEGNIFIDQSTNKPIDITSVNASQFNNIDPSLGEGAALAAQKNQNWTRFMIVFCVIFGLIAVGILVIIYYYFFKGRSFVVNPTDEPASSLLIPPALLSAGAPPPPPPPPSYVLRVPASAPSNLMPSPPLSPPPPIAAGGSAAGTGL
jgi:hypothetical protein